MSANDDRDNEYETINFHKALKGGENTKRLSATFNYNPEPVILQPLEVIVYDNFERALKAFRSLVQAERIISDFKLHERYEKPSVKKRRKSQEAHRRVIEAEIRQKKIMSGEYEKEQQLKDLRKEKKKQEKMERLEKQNKFEY